MQSGKFLGASATFFEVTKYLIFGIAAIIVLFALVGVPLFVEGKSMEPNFETGEMVIIERISYWGAKAIKRGDVVAATFPGDPKHTRLIKRVVGLPGETISAHEGKLTVNGAELSEPYKPRLGEPPYQELSAVALENDEYFLAGDNRPGSSDSRLWGAVARADIQGRASFVIWPLGAMRYVDRL
ncbi:MAG: signal peptidase I [Candidatus Berkelbacteria bacterium]|nr:MAG: signal peptidase I [Candidatus Berkelbacteria bacterium]QQG51741.1 MAG: signal peptidase I [Candidatus Berkelbacteria bacterium]